MFSVIQSVKNLPAMQETTCSAGGPGSIPGLRRSPGEGNGNPVQYSCLGNPMDRGAWQAIVHRVERIRHKLVTKPSTNVSGLNKSKAMTNLESILKSRHYFANKGYLVKAMIFPTGVVMYRCESWTIKKAERQIIDDFELWCWRRLLRALWTAERSNQS